MFTRKEIATKDVMIKLSERSKRIRFHVASKVTLILKCRGLKAI